MPPVFHTSLPFSSKAKIKDILHIWINGVDLSTLFWQLVQDSDQHEDLVTLSTTVQETLTAAEPKRNMLVVTSSASASHNALRMDGRDKHRILNGSERPDEGWGLQVLIELNYTKDVLSSLVHNCQTHVTAQLLVGFLRQVLWVHNGALCTNPPVPISINEAQVVRIAGHQWFHIFWHWFCVELKVFRQDTPPMAVATPSLQLACCWHSLPCFGRHPGGRAQSTHGTASDAEHGWLAPGPLCCRENLGLQLWKCPWKGQLLQRVCRASGFNHRIKKNNSVRFFPSRNKWLCNWMTAEHWSIQNSAPLKLAHAKCSKWWVS